MSDFGHQINFRQLFQLHGQVQIPMIQRDYAQGRPSETDVRDDFLAALESALRSAAGDPTLPLNLDFIYGNVERGRFSPLDGQQRLTTLFLLHWYLAWIDGRWSDFKDLFEVGLKSRFSYKVRSSSTEFFDQLVEHRPEKRPQEIPELSRWLCDQSWYRLSWRLDPTVQSTLVMLDAIHKRFASSSDLFERLISTSQPAITFQLLDLGKYKLSEDLYIKMNARGKLLTQFETFKARYERELGKQFNGETRHLDGDAWSIADFVAQRMDTAWSDLFWAHRDQETNLYDGAVMNLFRAVALVTHDLESDAYAEDVLSLRSASRPPSYADFHAKGWLDRNFTETLIPLLETWSAGGGALATQLPDNSYFDEKAMLSKVMAGPGELSYTEVVQLGAYVAFIRQHEQNIDADAFQEWMRIVRNLSFNTVYNRPDDLQRSMAALQTLLPNSAEILEYFTTFGKPISGFFSQQILEEALKARLILSHDGWRPLIDRAEKHDYFLGQIEFLLDFCGCVAASLEDDPGDWDDDLHLFLQEQFETYLGKAKTMFDENGLAKLDKYRWQRALLSIGNYLLPSGPNISFLGNSLTAHDSWKRLLRGSGPKVPEARELLHRLWDHPTWEMPISEQLDKQLDQIIAEATALEPWREAFIQTPKAIGYCRYKAIRLREGKIYLLNSRQMNGYHAELFGYCLYQQVLKPQYKEKQLAHLVACQYHYSYNTWIEPGISLTVDYEGSQLFLKIEYKNGHFIIGERDAEYHIKAETESIFIEDLNFLKRDPHHSTALNPAVIESKLLNISQALVNAAQTETIDA